MQSWRAWAILSVQIHLGVQLKETPLQGTWEKLQKPGPIMIITNKYLREETLCYAQERDPQTSDLAGITKSKSNYKYGKRAGWGRSGGKDMVGSHRVFFWSYRELTLRPRPSLSFSPHLSQGRHKGLPHPAFNFNHSSLVIVCFHE